MATQQFPSARGSQKLSSQQDSRELGRASEEALAEVDLGTWVSNSSKLSLELFGDFCIQHRCLLDPFMPRESCPTPKQTETRVTTQCPQDRAQVRVKTEGQKRFVTLAANASDVQMP